VDDILIASRHRDSIERIKGELANHFTIKDLGAAKYCLGIEVSRDREEIHLSQGGYIRDMLHKFGMNDCKPTRTPMDPGIKLHEIDNDSEANDPSLSFRELIGSLMYLAQGTRPDIAYAVSALSQWNTSYQRTH